MSKCEHCPIKRGECVGERPSHAFACGMAARGSPAELTWIAGASNVELPAPPPTPSLAAKAVGLVKAAAAFAASGFATVDRAEFDRRHAICEGCEHFDAKHEACNLCGCNLKAKPWIRDIQCRAGKW